MNFDRSVGLVGRVDQKPDVTGGLAGGWMIGGTYFSFILDANKINLDAKKNHLMEKNEKIKLDKNRIVAWVYKK